MLVLDLADAGDRGLAATLAGRADAVVHDFRAGTAVPPALDQHGDALRAWLRAVASADDIESQEDT